MRAVLAACRRLGLDQDARKEVQEELTGVASMAEMSERQLGELLDHLNRDYRGTNPNRAHISKIKALWWSLYWLGAIDEPADRALSAFVKRQTGIAALRFLDHRKAHSVVEALKSWLEREGVNWRSDADVADFAALRPSWERAEWDRWSVVEQIHHRLLVRDVIGADLEAYVAASLPIVGRRNQWNARQLDEIIRFLGKKWRGIRQ